MPASRWVPRWLRKDLDFRSDEKQSVHLGGKAPLMLWRRERMEAK